MPKVHRMSDVTTGHGCFYKNQKIPLLNGSDIPISELVGIKEFYVYSYDFELNKIVPGRAHSCRLTRKNQPLLKIILDNDEEIICTFDHKHMLKNGHYKEAKDLKEGDSLNPLYRRIVTDVGTKKFKTYEIGEYRFGYEQILQPNNKWEFTHRAVFNWKYSKLTIKILNTCHHKNFNSRDNSPKNLLSVDNKKHMLYHTTKLKKYWSDPTTYESRKNRIEKMKISRIRFLKNNLDASKNHSLFMKKYCRENPEKNIFNTNNPSKNPIYLNKAIESNQKYWTDLEWRKKHSEKTKLGMMGINFKETNKKGGITKREKFALKKGFSSYQDYYDYICLLYKSGCNYVEIAKQLNTNSWTVSTQINENLTKNNHKVKSIEFYGYDDVYCFSVDKHHNFALSAGVFVHNCFPPTIPATYSPDVFANGHLNVVRYGDSIVPHTCPGDGTHGGTYIGQKCNVFVNNKNVQLQSDPISCGDFVDTHDPTWDCCTKPLEFLKPAILVNPSTVDFGTRVVGSTGKSPAQIGGLIGSINLEFIPVVVMNTGGPTLIVQFAIYGPINLTQKHVGCNATNGTSCEGYPDFLFKNVCWPLGLSGGGSTVFYVAFKPLSIGIKEMYINIYSQPEQPIQTVSLRGIGI